MRHPRSNLAICVWQALVYIRQSTPQQVVNNQESTRRQYDLVDRARQMGGRRPAFMSSTMISACRGPAVSTAADSSAWSRQSAWVRSGSCW